MGYVSVVPKDLITVPSSLVVMLPSPSLSKREKASLNSAICSSVSWSTCVRKHNDKHRFQINKAKSTKNKQIQQEKQHKKNVPFYVLYVGKKSTKVERKPATEASSILIGCGPAQSVTRGNSAARPQAQAYFCGAG